MPTPALHPSSVDDVSIGSPGSDADTRPATRKNSLSTSVLKGGLSLLSTQPVTWGASLVVAILVPHFLGDANLGRYAVAWTVSQIVGVLATLGVPSYLTRRVATQPGRLLEVSSNALVLAYALSVAVVIGGLGVVWLMFGFSDTIGLLLALGLVWVLCNTPQQVLTALLMGQERHVRYAWIGAGSLVVTTIASIGVLALGGGVIGYMIAGVAAAAGVSLFSWRTSGIKVTRGSVSRGEMVEIGRGGAPFLAWDLTLRVHSEINRVLMAFFARDAVVGWYAAANRIISIPVFIPTLITTPLLPALSRAQTHEELKTALRHALTAVLLLSIPCSAMIAAIAPAIPDLFHWPVEFQHSIPLMMILSIQQPLVGVDMVLGAALVAQHREHRWLRVFMLAAATNVGLNALFIPATEQLWGNGGIGSAVVSSLSELVMLGGAVVLLPRGLVGRDSILTALRVVVSGVVLFAAASAVLPINLMLALVAGCVAYAVAVLLTGALRISDLKEIVTVSRQMVGARLARAQAAA